MKKFKSLMLAALASAALAAPSFAGGHGDGLSMSGEIIVGIPLDIIETALFPFLIIVVISFCLVFDEKIGHIPIVNLSTSSQNVSKEYSIFFIFTPSIFGCRCAFEVMT